MPEGMTATHSGDFRWGFLGASRIGRGALAPAVQAARGNTLYAIAARDLGRAEPFARDFGAARAYGSYQELLADERVDAVYNALPGDQHLPLTLAALASGKHVLCEKPLALNAGEVRQMRAASQASGKLVLEAFSYRFHPQIERARELAHSGALGELRFARAAFGFVLDRPDDFRWQAQQGGGALYDVGCYCLNVIRLVTNREPARAFAVQRTRGDVDADLTAALDLGGPNSGLSAHFDCSFTAASNQHFTLVGGEAILTLALPFGSKDQAVELHVGNQVERFEPVDPYRLMVEHFARAALGQEPPRFTLEDAEAQARAMDALFESAKTGEAVSV